MKLRFWFCLLLVAGLAGCGTDAATRSNDYLPLTSIEIASTNPAIANLTSNQFTAIGNFSGQITRDITTEVNWSSSDTLVATVDNRAGSEGRATGVAPGTTTISATLDGVVASFELTVTSATISSVSLAPLMPTVAKGLAEEFSATGLFSDATRQDLTTDVLWSSTDIMVATVSNERGSEGLARGVEVGSADISAAFDGVTAATTITVSAAVLQALSLLPADSSMVSLSKGAFTAVGTFSDNTTQDLTTMVSWNSTASTVAGIDSGGLVTALSSGLTTISAGLNGVTGATGLSVTGGDLVSLSIDPASGLQLVDGTSSQLKASGQFDNGTSRDVTEMVTWDSDDLLVATISNIGGLKGRLRAESTGSATVKATFDTLFQETQLTVVSASLNSVSLAPLTPSTAVGTSTQLDATGSFSGGITQDLTLDVTWGSNTPSVATVSNTDPDRGRASGVTVGSATITADFGSAPTANVDLTVTGDILLSLDINPISPQLAPGEEVQLSVIANYQGGASQDVTRDAVWTTSDSSVAGFLYPDKDAGRLTGVDLGSADITASFGGLTATEVTDVQ